MMSDNFSFVFLCHSNDINTVWCQIIVSPWIEWLQSCLACSAHFGCDVEIYPIIVIAIFILFELLANRIIYIAEPK